MYTAYFVNTITGELRRTSQPCDNPKGKDWKQISWEQYNEYCLIFTHGIQEGLKTARKEAKKQEEKQYQNFFAPHE
jgi:hypothetical protein